MQNDQNLEPQPPQQTGQKDTPPSGQKEAKEAKDDNKPNDNKNYDQAYIDKLLADEREANKIAFEEALNEALKEEREKAKLGEKEKAEFEKKKTLEKLEKREAEITRKELEVDTIKLLSQKQMSVELMPYVVSTNLKDTMKRIDEFKTVFDKAVTEQVETRLKGKTPQGSTVTPTTEEEIREQVKRAMKR